MQKKWLIIDRRDYAFVVLSLPAGTHGDIIRPTILQNLSRIYPGDPQNTILEYVRIPAKEHEVRVGVHLIQNNTLQTYKHSGKRLLSPTLLALQLEKSAGTAAESVDIHGPRWIERLEFDSGVLDGSICSISREAIYTDSPWSVVVQGMQLPELADISRRMRKHARLFTRPKVFSRPTVRFIIYFLALLMGITAFTYRKSLQLQIDINRAQHEYTLLRQRAEADLLTQIELNKQRSAERIFRSFPGYSSLAAVLSTVSRGIQILSVQMQDSSFRLELLGGSPLQEILRIRDLDIVASAELPGYAGSINASEESRWVIQGSFHKEIPVYSPRVAVQ